MSTLADEIWSNVTLYLMMEQENNISSPLVSRDGDFYYSAMQKWVRRKAKSIFRGLDWINREDEIKNSAK